MITWYVNPDQEIFINSKFFLKLQPLYIALTMYTLIRVWNKIEIIHKNIVRFEWLTRFDMCIW